MHSGFVSMGFRTLLPAKGASLNLHGRYIPHRATIETQKDLKFDFTTCESHEGNTFVFGYLT